MQLIHKIATRLARRHAAATAARRQRQARAWRRDPLSHPALSDMSPHQLADLPLERGLFRDEASALTSAAVIPLVRERALRGAPRTAAQGC
jgi:uncharacterized protein YjiS (DUF1127 family)